MMIRCYSIFFSFDSIARPKTIIIVVVDMIFLFLFLWLALLFPWCCLWLSWRLWSAPVLGAMERRTRPVLQCHLVLESAGSSKMFQGRCGMVNSEDWIEVAKAYPMTVVVILAPHSGAIRDVSQRERRFLTCSGA